MQAIVPYFGSKWSYADWIISHFPPKKLYNVFVDVFGGSSAIIANAPVVDLMVYNDMDHELVNLFSVLRTEHEAFIKSVYFTLYSFQEMELTYDVEARESLIKTNPVEAARRFYVRCMQTFGGYKGAGGRGWARGTKQKNGHIRAFNNLDKLYTFSELCKSWQTECGSYEVVMPRYSSPHTLFYLDPPYLVEECAEGRESTYLHDIKTVAEHEKLLKTILNTDGFILLSGYDSVLYNDYLKGWGKELKSGYTNLRSMDEETGEFVYEQVDREEALWLSPNVVRELNKPKQVGLFNLQLEVA